MKKRILILISTLIILIQIYLLAVLAISALYPISRINEEDLSYLRQKTEGIDHLMIVAHPDDESIWGGAHLLEEDYLVVCLTNGSCQDRAREFQAALEQTGDVGIILNYPDKILGLRSSWRFQRKSVIRDLEKILSLKEWNAVATHNQDGEYGHIQHRLTHSLTLQAFDSTAKDHPNASLFCFGAYHDPDSVKEAGTPMSDDMLQSKLTLLSVYHSQGFIDKSFGHMFPYEAWQQIR
jgi:hypothetical protein